MKSNGQAILTEKFYCEGRGPESLQYHWAYSGRILRAIDFINPDETKRRHLLFSGVQVFMVTGEEVINYTSVNPLWRTTRRAGILCLGKSAWLESFSPRHLEKCVHYQIMFYDELLDIICESIEVREGGYLQNE